ncbi:MAG: hypothetical protein PHH43_05840 [Candidatus Cloacimonetes bacterium]|nr:hypothetical protein [Candidatus Cloacimonadota bacterium]
MLGRELTDKISNATLTHIWGNLIIILESDSIDMFMMYWELMDNRLRDYRFQKLYPRTQKPVSSISSTEENNYKPDTIDIRMRYYHSALGGLVLYLQKYNTLSRIFSYTSSEPPEYYLLPNTLKDVYELFVFFMDPWGDNFSFISFIYYFPHIEGVNQDNLIKKWICSYLAILFLRLYKLRPQYFEQELLKVTELPQTQREKRIWLECIESFRSHIKEWLKQPDMLEKAGLGNVSLNWQYAPAKEPDAVIDKLKADLTQAMQNSETNQPLADDKVKQFFASTTKQFNDYLLSIHNLLSSTPKSQECSKHYVNGSRILLEKSCFQDDVALHMDNFDSILASMVITHLKRQLSNSFVVNTSDRYQLKAEEIFPAIDKLKLDKNIHIIINMNLNLGYYIDVLKVKGLSETVYDGISIKSIDSYNRQAGYSVFILEKKNLPYLKFNELTTKELDKYSLKKVEVKYVSDVDYKIYASVINLIDGDKKEVLQEVKDRYPDKDIDLYVLVMIGLIAEIQWDKDIKMVQIQQSLHRESQQLLSNISDIRNFNK